MKDNYSILNEYLLADVVYQQWKNGEIKTPNDYEQFCIDNCTAIEEIMEENKELKEKIKRIINIVDTQILNGELITYEDFANKLKSEAK